MTPDLFLVVCTVIAIMMLVMGFYTWSARHKAQLTSRIRTYAEIEKEAAATTAVEQKASGRASNVLQVLLGHRFMEQLAKDLAQADVPLRAFEYLLLQVCGGVAGFLTGYYVLNFLHSGLILGLFGFLAPAIFLRIRRQQRRTKFARQLADALMLLVSSLRSGYSFLKGMELVASEMDDPISKELKRTLREVHLGTTVDQALLNLSNRINNTDLEIVVGAFLVQRDVGGNLTELMEKVAETIRERIRIQGDIRVLTAQGRLSGVVVSAIPFVVFLMITLTNPGYFAVMLEPPTFRVWGMSIPLGVAMLIGAVFLQMLGALWIFRIVNIKL
jgi:tight adherence protein B